MDRDTIFISHASPDDNDFVRWLGDELASRGYSIWADVFHLKGGTPFWSTIEEVLRQRAIKVVFVVSRGSVSLDRGGVRNELSLADGVRKSLRDPGFIVPVRIDDTPFNELPIQIHQLNSLDFSQDRDARLVDLLDTLEAAKVPRTTDAAKTDPAGIRGRIAEPAVARRDDTARMPTIAVLPFQNLSGDPDQDYFADGMVDDLIAALSRFRSFAVIGRRPSFARKGISGDAKEVAAELGVRYLLEGSVRRGGSRLRLVAQLLGGEDGTTLWAETFEGPIEDVFDFQDRITRSVAAIVEPQIQRAELERARRERPNSVAAYDLYLRGVAQMYVHTPSANAEALNLFEQALAIEPENSVFLAFASWSLEYRTITGWPPHGPDDRARAVDLAHRAIRAAGDNARVLANCCLVIQTMGGEFERGQPIVNRAVMLNPNDVAVLHAAGCSHSAGGDLEEGLRLLRRAIEIQPNHAYEYGDRRPDLRHARPL
jgi:TolB-like protein